ncbi:protein unc-13 homolog B-like [Xenopus laevis]|uniref:Protein unc-13 homolog B-like n=1 Tax=Xenopus laevis TaxID=8355 RepID=A0A8J1MQM9_XENLA|nr:protein unc-13 homolog B-like [Xenopus laevis]
MCMEGAAWDAVKKGHFNGISDKSYTYVIIKIEKLKCTTASKPGQHPCWEQDYIFDIDDPQKGFLVEVWKSSWLRDSVIGSIWIPLKTIRYAIDEGSGEWWTLYSEMIPNENETYCVQSPTEHKLLLDVFFAVPFDGVTENQDLYPRNESLWKNSDSAKVSTSSQNIHSTIKKETRNEDVIFTSNVVKERWGRAIQKVICL